VAEGLSVSAGRQSGEEQPFLAEASSHLEETNKAPAIGPHFAGACSPTYMRTRSRSGSRQETLPRPPRFGQKIRQEIFHDFEWRLHTEFLLRCDEASSCPKWVSRPWSMGRWRQHDIKLGCAVHRKHQFLRNSRPAATRDAEEVFPGYIFFVD
jgi:hypothetical protein